MILDYIKIPYDILPISDTIKEILKEENNLFATKELFDEKLNYKITKNQLYLVEQKIEFTGWVGIFGFYSQNLMIRFDIEFNKGIIKQIILLHKDEN